MVIHQGDVFGEFTMFDEQRTTTATVTALSEVTVLTLNHKVFAELVQQHSTTAIEVMRVLMQRWQESSDFDKSATGGVDLSLVMGIGKGVGATTISCAMAAALAQDGSGKVVYTEYPQQLHLPGLFNFNEGTTTYQHPDGFDTFVPRSTLSVPSVVRMTLILEQLIEDYASIVISLPGRCGTRRAPSLQIWTSARSPGVSSILT